MAKFVVPDQGVVKVPPKDIVYFVTSPDTHDFPVKIGKSRNDNFPRRLSQMQTGCPFNLIPVLLIDTCGDPNFEKEVHEELRASWLRGEWFRRTDEVSVFIHCYLKMLGDWMPLYGNNASYKEIDGQRFPLAQYGESSPKLPFFLNAEWKPRFAWDTLSPFVD